MLAAASEKAVAIVQPGDNKIVHQCNLFCSKYRPTITQKMKCAKILRRIVRLTYSRIVNGFLW